MSHLNQVVQLYALVDGGLSHGRAVDTCVSANLYVVLNHYDTNLWNLVVALCVRSKSESVGTNHATCVYCNIISKFASLIDGDVGVEQAFFAYLYAVAYHRVSIYLTAVAHGCAIADNGKRADVNVLANLGFWRYRSQRVDTYFGGLHALVELQQLSHALVGVLYANQRATYWLLQFNVFVNQYYARLCVVYVMCIFGV